MHAWKSPADVAEEFGLAANTGGDTLRLELRKVVSELHPDKNGGSFTGEAEKGRYLRAQEALDFLESHDTHRGALIPVSQLPAVIKAISEAMVAKPAADIATLHSAALAESRSHIARRFALPKIGSSAFAAITAFLVAFGDKFANHPVLGPLIGDRIGQLFLLTLMAYSGAFFLMSWWQERRAEARSTYLMSESALGVVFDRVQRNATTDANAGRVSSRQIQDAIEDLAGFRRPTNPLFPFGSGIDLGTIEKAAALQTQRLLERQLIRRLEIPAIDTWYEVQATQR